MADKKINRKVKGSNKRGYSKIMHKHASKANAHIRKRAKANVRVKKAIAKVHAKITAKNTSMHKIKSRSMRKVIGNTHKAEKKIIKEKPTNVTMPEDAKKVIDTIMSNQAVIDYLKKNVSKRSPEVISLLSVPRTDEYIAATLGMKVNAVRRILNIMQGYGVTNYHISKNDNGWLSFGWYMNANKLPTFLDYIEGTTKNKTTIDDNCNDYFICKKCFDSEKFVYTFDAAFEAGFKCKTCNSKLERIEKSEIETLISNTASNTVQPQQTPAVQASPKYKIEKVATKLI